MINILSLRSFLSNKIIPVSSSIYLTWGIVSTVLFLVSPNIEERFIRFSVLVIGCIAGMYLNLSFTKKQNTKFYLATLTDSQKLLLLSISSVVMFSFLLNILFDMNEDYLYIYPLWTFSAGIINILVGSQVNKKLIYFFGILLTFVSYLITLYLIIFDRQYTDIIFISLVCALFVSLGHILLGIYMKKIEKNVK